MLTLKKSNVRQFEIDFFGAKLVRQPSEIRSTYLVSQPVQSPQQSCPKAPFGPPLGAKKKETKKRDSMAADPSQVDGIAFNGGPSLTEPRH